MATRTQARESVISLLYAYDLGNDKISKFSDEILEDKKIRNKQKAFADLMFDENDFTVTNELCDIVLSLPMHPYLTEADIDAVCDVIRSYIK